MCGILSVGVGMWGILSVLHRGWGCGVFCLSYMGGGDVGYFVSLTWGVGMWGILSVLHGGWGCGVFCQSYIGGGDGGYFVSPM